MWPVVLASMVGSVVGFVLAAMMIDSFVRDERQRAFDAGADVGRDEIADLVASGDALHLIRSGAESLAFDGRAAECYAGLWDDVRRCEACGSMVTRVEPFTALNESVGVAETHATVTCFDCGREGTYHLPDGFESLVLACSAAEKRAMFAAQLEGVDDWR